MSCSYCIIGTRLNIHHFEGSMTLTEGHQCYEAAKICFHVHMLIVRSLRGIASTFFFSESLKVFPSQTNKWKQFLSHLFSCDQAALWMVQSVHPSVCLSHLFDYVPIIVSSRNFQELLPMTEVMSMQKVKVIKIVEFDPNWPFPDCNSSLNTPMATKWCTKLEVALKRCLIVFQCHPSNFKVTQLKKLSNLTKIGCFQTVTPVWIHWWIWNDAQSLM